MAGESAKLSWKEKIRKHHRTLMILSCLLPFIIGLAGTLYFGWQRGYLVWLFLLLCPLVHYWMMKEMHGPEHHAHTKPAKGKSCH